jgi:hypothetical protein
MAEITGLNEKINENDSIENASKYLTHTYIKNIISSIESVDPYVLPVLIQSVFVLSQERFSTIEKEFRDLVELAKKHHDDWVPEVFSGELISPSGNRFKILNDIPEMVSPYIPEQIQTEETQAQ